MKRVLSLALSIFLLLGCVLPVFAADGVPAPVMEATKSVVRILSEYSRNSATGSGFVIKNEPGEVLIATNDHVVEGNPHTISVWVSEDRQVEAEIVFTTSERDLCVLKLKEAVDMKPLKLSKEEPQHGAAIYAVGFPGAGDILSDTAAHTSDSATITDGIISAIRTFTIEKGGRSVKLLQVNAAINSGNSGGPLFNTAGEVIGINTYKVNAESQGIFGSVAVSELWDLLDQYGIVIPEEEPEATEEPIQEPTAPELNPVWLAGGAVVVVIVSLAVVITVRKKSKTKKGKDQEVQKVALTKYMERYPQGLGISGAVSLLLPAAIQLRNLHNDGKLHLQICPDNILVGAEGSSLRDAIGGESARFNSGFAAPEVYKSAGFGITSDIYSFAAVLYYAATGRIPSNSLQQELLEQDFALLTDEAFAGIIRSCMAFSSFNRTQSMQELIYSIAAFNVIKPAATVQQADASAVEKPASTAEKASKPKKKSRKWIPVTIVLALVCTAAVLMMQKREPVSLEIETTIPAETMEAVQLSPEAIKYNEAVDLFKNGEYGKAAIAFAKLGDYRDAKEISKQIWDAIADRDVIIAASGYTLAVKADGTVEVCGQYAPDVKDWADIIAVSGGENYVAGLQSDGTVLFADRWGNERILEDEKWSDIVAIEAGYGLKANGTTIVVDGDVASQTEEQLLKMQDIVRFQCGFGSGIINNFVKTADNNIFVNGKKVDVPGIVDIWSNALGVAVLKEDGTIIVQPFDSYQKNAAILAAENWSEIVDLTGSPWKQLVGLRSDGTVVSVGDNTDKQLNVEEWTDIVAVSASNFHTVGLRSNGTLVTCGSTRFDALWEAEKWTDLKVPADRDALLAAIELDYITGSD